MVVRRVLVASGDLEFIQQIASGVDGRGFSVVASYSHRDAAYYLHNEAFSVAIIDLRLTQPETGESSAAILSRLRSRPPLLVYGDGETTSSAFSDVPLTGLDEATLRQTLMSALRIPHYEPSTFPFVDPSPALADEPPPSGHWHDDEIKTLFSLSRSLTEVLDLSEVLNRVVEAARRLTNAEEGMILLPDENSEQLYLRAKIGIDAKAAENFRIRTQDSLAGNVFTSGQPVLVSSQGPQKIKTEYFANALLYVPILLNGVTLGVLGVMNREKATPFSQRHLELLVNLASYAAIAINNARIHGESVRRTNELKGLVDASQSVNASLSLDRTLIAACEHLGRILNVHCAQIYEVGTDRQMFRCRATFVQARWRSGAEQTIALSRRDSEGLKRYGVTELVRDQRLDPVQVQFLRRVGAGYALLLPVAYGDTMFGALIAYRAKEPETKLTRARLQRAQRALDECSQTLIGGSGERTGTNAFNILGDLRVLLEAERIEFGVTNQEGSGLRIRYAYGGMVWNGEEAGSAGMTVPFQDNFSFNYSIEDGELTPTVQAILKATYGFAVLGLPVKVRGQLQGLAVMVDNLRPRVFTKREIDLAKAVVGQAGTAIDNAQLVEDLEQSLHELKAAQAKLVQTARLSAMGELAAAVAHQINNPLTTIVLDGELLLDKQEPGSSAYESVSAIVRAGKRATGVVRRLLSSARPDSGNAPRIPVDIVASLQDTVTLVLSYFQKSAIQLVLNLPDAPVPPVLAPQGELDDVWLNLLINAHDVLVGRQQPRVEVAVMVDRAHNSVTIEVSDNGPGIPDEMQETIFEPFFTTKPHGQGTGLGLYICRQVVTRVGGEIGVTTAGGGGAVFTVNLPTSG
ncbi:MAG: GAF domain-containing protein [Anaerolineae bacterium]|nr:GAF domain-containing protein [Anaerolineae bacterium]NUQ02682.1 GAF domain-containing protein [Anaerolineae bacterium]